MGELIVTLTVKGVKLSRATGVFGLFGIQLDKEIHAQDFFAEIPFVQGLTQNGLVQFLQLIEGEVDREAIQSPGVDCEPAL